MSKKNQARHRRPRPSQYRAGRTLSTAGLTLAAFTSITVAAASPALAAETTSPPTGGEVFGLKPPNPNPISVPSTPAGGVSLTRGVYGLKRSIERVVEKYHSLPINRPGFVKSLREEVSQSVSGEYNTMVFNTEDQSYEQTLSGGPEGDQPFRTSVEYDGTEYTVWVFKEGTFTNKGDGGDINWGFSGLFDANGSTITFHAPAGSSEGSEVVEGSESQPEPEPEEAVEGSEPQPEEGSEEAVDEAPSEEQSADQGEPPAPPEDCGAMRVMMNVQADSLGISQHMEEQTAAMCLSDGQERITQKLRDVLIAAGGYRYNALVFNTNQDYAWQDRADMPFSATVAVGDKMYGVWLVDSGTFENKGDGGYENWAFGGSFNVSGNKVAFESLNGDSGGGSVDASSEEKGRQCVTMPFAAGTVTPGATGDTLGIAGQMTDVVAMSREDCVKTVAERAFQAGGQKYNVLVANQANDLDNQLNGVQSYVTVKYDDVYYGVWVFEDGAVTNNGDRGFDNWAVMGAFDSSNDGKTATFHKL